ncbi:MAG: heparinase II/III domain-containing protein, partial [Acidimicrobiales bacterium]
MGAAPDWHLIHDGPGRWPVVDWWRIDIRSACRRGDVKWAWELGRHRHLVILARAHHCEPDDPRWIETLGGHLRSWLVSNPLEMGIHWYSNLEVALRSLNWLQVLALTGKALDPGLRADMEHVLYHSGFHLAADLPYTLSTMRNNHLLGDALGLVALGTSFPHDGHARRWLGLGRQLFDWQLRRHFRDDGSSVEDSLSYHRFVLEMLAALLLLREAPQARRRLAAGSELLARLGAIEGPVPAYGDWDEGRVLASSGDPLDVGGTARLGLALGGTAAVPEPWYEDFDEVAWYAPPRPESGTAPTRYRNPWEQRSEPAPRPKQRRSTPVPEPGGFDVGAHIARAGSGGFVCWLKAGAAPSHGHADLTSVSLWRNGRWLTGDPGTGSYNGSIERRNYFRSSLAHNVLRLEGRDQLVPHRAFRWQQRAQGHLGAPLRLGELVVMWGGHDAYRTLDAPRRVVRAAALCPSGLSVIDWVDGQPGVPYALSIPLGPEISWEQDQATLPDGDVIRVDIPVDSAR